MNKQLLGEERLARLIGLLLFGLTPVMGIGFVVVLEELILGYPL